MVIMGWKNVRPYTVMGRVRGRPSTLARLLCTRSWLFNIHTLFTCLIFSYLYSIWSIRAERRELDTASGGEPWAKR